MAKRVLIVDGDASCRELLCDICVSIGLFPELAINAKKAIESIKNKAPDIIITDLLMPKINGIKLLETVKSESRTNDIPVIVVSGIDDVREQEKCFEAGASDYLTKPLDINQFIQRIKLCLKKAELQKARTESQVLKNEDILLMKYVSIIQNSFENNINETQELIEQHKSLSSQIELAITNIRSNFPPSMVDIINEKLKGNCSFNIDSLLTNYEECSIGMTRGINQLTSLFEQTQKLVRAKDMVYTDTTKILDFKASTLHTILLVGNNNALSTQSIKLKSNGFNIITANNEKQLFNSVRFKHPHIILAFESKSLEPLIDWIISAKNDGGIKCPCIICNKEAPDNGGITYIKNTHTENSNSIINACKKALSI